MVYREIIKRFCSFFWTRTVNVREKLIEIGLFPGQPPVLEYVVTHEGCTQVEIAQTLGFSAASIATSTKRLQKAGMLMKTQDGQNLRQNKLTATEKGIETLKESHRCFHEIDEKIFQGFTEDELAVLSGYFDRMIINLQDGCPDTLSKFDTVAIENRLKREAGGK